jgi:hypothetical protein
MLLEGISKPSQDDNQTGKLNKTVKEVRVILVASNNPSKVLNPTDRSFYFPTPTVAAHFAPVLRGRFYPIRTVRTDQVDASTLQPGSQRITVGGHVVDQATRLSSKHSRFEKRFDQCDFVGTGTGGVDASRETVSVGKNHDLGSLASLGLANLFTPFFAEANVPSAKDSSWSTSPLRSSKSTHRFQATCQIPDSVHCRCRRQQVEVEGKCLGRSFHRAPLRSIQRIPSMQPRDAAAGRPPLGPIGVSANRSDIKCHCSSVSSFLGSVVDPVSGSAASRDRFVMSNLL